MINHRIGLILLMLLIANAEARVEFDRQDLETWADTTFGQAFSDHRFSGMAVTLIQDGETKLSRGYGYSDLEANTPVNPDDTCFIVASISKTFTATALAQLVDRGLIDSLDDPANRYLKRMQIPEAFGKQVTLWHLLTHRAGYEDYLSHIGNLEPGIQVPVNESLIAAMTPEIVREPGTLTVYSNFSTAVLGILIEDVSGLTLGQYMKENIFEPLAMDHTELRYSHERAAGMGVPYAFFPNGESQAIPYLAVHPLFAPAAAVVTTASDMVRYMAAHLDAGRGGANAILSPEMFDLMHTRKVGNHPETGGVGMKFFVGNYAGQDYFGHGGDWPGWNSIMLMFPESNAGYFAVVMADSAVPSLKEKVFGGRRMRPVPGVTVGEPYRFTDLIIPFAVRYLGPPKQISHFSHSDKIRELPGTYWREKRSHTRMDAFFELLEIDYAIIDVEGSGPAALEINGRGPYKPISNNTFGLAIDTGRKDTNEPIFLEDALTFTGDEASGVTRLISSDGLTVYNRVGLFQNPRFMLWLFISSALVGVTGFLTVCWPFVSRAGLYGKWSAVGLATTLLLVLFPVYVGFAEGEGWSWYKLTGQGARYLVLAALGNVLFLFSLLIIGIAVSSWLSNCWGNGFKAACRRAHYSLLALACLGLIIVLKFANMIGFHLPV